MALTTTETLVSFSMEGFLTQADRHRILSRMSQLGIEQPELFAPGRASAMHSVPGLTAEEVTDVYEPHGRVEITTLPAEVVEILDDAAGHSLPVLRRPFPAVDCWGSWTYLEYHIGQCITPHADTVTADPSSYPRQIAGVSVVLTDDFAGGHFFVETCGSDTIWADAPDGTLDRLLTDSADLSSPGFAAVPRTRWRARQRAGDALVYGAQLVHGTEPVLSGVARKIIGWFMESRPC